ncbi:MAG: cellulase family glycosylhydrolase, partial [Atopobiaceae bacterium]|nr:cellulase family glycosylhydrolase [Atopobiaceae bacterium]
MKVRGVNLGNWLVLEKWMGVSPLSSARSEDDRGLIDEMSPTQLIKALDEHRVTYITERDFAWMEAAGANLVRIPVPYHLFGSPHHTSCVEYLDQAFAWAERHRIAVLVDLHTVPLSQNGFDNGGYLGLCAWARDPARIDFVVDLLERIARRYAGHPALWGIEALNEPATRAVLWQNLVR